MVDILLELGERYQPDTWWQKAIRWTPIGLLAESPADEQSIILEQILVERGRYEEADQLGRIRVFGWPRERVPEAILWALILMPQGRAAPAISRGAGVAEVAAVRVPAVLLELAPRLEAVWAKQMEALAKSGAITAMANLTPAAARKLGNLLNMADRTVSDVIRMRGGGAGNIAQLETGMAQRTLGEIAELAAQGNAQAIKALKMVKQAGTKGQRNY